MSKCKIINTEFKGIFLDKNNKEIPIYSERVTYINTKTVKLFQNEDLKRKVMNESSMEIEPVE